MFIPVRSILILILSIYNEKLPGFTGIHHMIVESIGKSDIDIRRDLF
jgi:hypothetical protein